MLKRLIFQFILCCCIINSSLAQKIIFSTAKASDLKLGFALDSVNKYLDKPIHLVKLTQNDQYNFDTLYASYAQCKVRLAFDSYIDNATKKWKTRLVYIYCADSTIETKSGIKIGDDKFDIIKRLGDSRLLHIPEAELSKGHSEIILYDAINRSMTFHFINNKLVSIAIEAGVLDEC